MIRRLASWAVVAFVAAASLYEWWTRNRPVAVVMTPQALDEWMKRHA